MLNLHTALTSQQASVWDSFIEQSPQTHFFQKSEWARFEKSMGQYEPHYLWADQNGTIALAAILLRKAIPLLPYALYEIRCGPVFNEPAVLEEALNFLETKLNRSAIRLEMNPRWMPSDASEVIRILEAHGFQRLPDPMHLRYHDETVTVDLTPDFEDVLKGFRKTTQLEIKKALDAGIQIDFANSQAGMNEFFDLYEPHCRARGGSPLPRSYFDGLCREFLYTSRNGFVALARHEGMVLSAAVLLRSGYRIWYTYGASHLESKKHFPVSHLLHWQSMQQAKRLGCSVYDLGGALQSAQPDHPTYGVVVFKTGFSRKFSSFLPTYFKIYHPALLALVNKARAVRRALQK